MKIIFSLLFILTHLQSSADVFSYTVIAKSGLSLRAEKSLSSERLAVLTFGEKVIPKTLLWQEKLTVEEIDGFWISVSYKNIEGYMFSGFLFPGEVHCGIKGKENNEEFIFMYEFFHEIEDESPVISYRNYDPLRKWYGVNFHEDKTTFEPITFKYNIDYKANQMIYDDWIKGEHELPFPYYWDTKFNQVSDFKPIPEKQFHFFIGTKASLPKSIPSNFLYDFEKNLPRNKFLDVGENWSFQLDGYNLTFETNPDSLSLNEGYFLKVNLNSKNSSTSQLLYKGFKSQGHRNKIYFTPSIEWLGDLNQDGIPDILTSEYNMSDGCGGETTGKFFISNLEGDKITFKQMTSFIMFLGFENPRY